MSFNQSLSIINRTKPFPYLEIPNDLQVSIPGFGYVGDALEDNDVKEGSIAQSSGPVVDSPRYLLNDVCDRHLASLTYMSSMESPSSCTSPFSTTSPYSATGTLPSSATSAPGEIKNTWSQKYLCKGCGKSYASSSALGKHGRNVHGDKPPTCTACKKRFRDWNYVKKKHKPDCVRKQELKISTRSEAVLAEAYRLWHEWGILSNAIRKKMGYLA